MNNGHSYNHSGQRLAAESSDYASDYYDHVDREQVRYVAEFEAFWGRLTPKQRKVLHERGVSGPVIEFSSNAELDRDLAEKPVASYSEDLVEKLDKFSDQITEKFALPGAIAIPLACFLIHMIEQQSIAYKAWLFGKVCGVMLNAKNAKLAAAGLAFASNLASLNELGSMREYAKKNNLSPEAVSKVKRKWQAELQLPDSPHSKDAEARANYSAVQSTDRHWRKTKVTAAALRDHRAALAVAVN
jgi:hypothetical protein